MIHKFWKSWTAHHLFEDVSCGWCLLFALFFCLLNDGWSSCSVQRNLKTYKPVMQNKQPTSTSRKIRISKISNAYQWFLSRWSLRPPSCSRSLRDNNGILCWSKAYLKQQRWDWLQVNTKLSLHQTDTRTCT